MKINRMKTVSMSGSLRENVGKKDAKALRRQGLIPCVMYGGKEQVIVAVPDVSFKDVIYTPESCLIKLDVDGKPHNVVLQEAQFHPVNGKLLHCDFLEIFPDKPVKMEVPVKLTGSSPGVMKGGKLVLKLRKLRIKGLMDALPDNIEVNISKLNIADSIKVGDIKTKNVEFLDAPNNVIVTVKATRGVVAGGTDDEEAATETEAEAEAAE
jgi:large subunit ribosomal protein L25